MTRTPKRLIQGIQLPTAATALYTAPANTKTEIAAMTLCNTSGAAVNVTVYLVPSAGAAAAANTVLAAFAVAAGASKIVSEAIGHKLESGDSIQAIASASTSVSLTASGYEVT